MKLEMYTVPACGRCTLVRKLLTEAGIQWAEIDASKSLGALRRLKKLSGGAAVPVLVLGQKSWNAQSPDQARRAVADIIEVMANG